MRNSRNRMTGTDNVIVMPDIYAERLAVQEAEVDAIELVANDDDPSYGFNPYDTARLYKKKGS